MNNFGAKQKYFSSKYLCKIVTEYHMYSLINLLSWITVKRVYMAYLGQ